MKDVKDMLHSENLFFHSQQSLGSGRIPNISRHVKREQWHKRILSNTVLEAPAFESHLQNKSHDYLGELILKEKKKSTFRYSFTVRHQYVMFNA